jgi:hypothetical protein
MRSFNIISLLNTLKCNREMISAWPVPAAISDVLFGMKTIVLLFQRFTISSFCLQYGWKGMLKWHVNFSYAPASQRHSRKIWGYRGDYEEYRLLAYTNPVLTSQETHHISATEASLLMLCKILGFHGGDCEEWRLLAYKNPVRTSQETLRLRCRVQPVNAM